MNPSAHGNEPIADRYTAEKEAAQVAYRETQYGVRLPQGQIEPVSIGPAEAQRYREAGVDLHERSRVVFMPTVSEWRVSSPPASTPREERGECGAPMRAWGVAGTCGAAAGHEGDHE